MDGDDSLAPRFFHRVPRHERRVPRRAGRGQRRGEPAGDDGDHGQRRRGDLLALCLEGYAAGDALRTMPCAHTFHPARGCIVRRLDGDHGRSGTESSAAENDAAAARGVAVQTLRQSDQQSQENGDHGGCML